MELGRGKMENKVIDKSIIDVDEVKNSVSIKNKEANNSKQYNEGSKWRKWDLHVHTPYSTGYKGTWEQFVHQIKESDCAVIGINDYYSVAGYKKIKEENIDIGKKKYFLLLR
jgi:hypothetical protein